MAHYARVVNGKVVQVIVAEADVLDSIPLEGELNKFPSKWVQTSYNTIGGQHLLGGTPLRKNYAGIGFTYDEVRDAFIPPKIYNAWILNEDTCLWEPPFPKPDEDNTYLWDNETDNWKLLED